MWLLDLSSLVDSRTIQKYSQKMRGKSIDELDEMAASGTLGSNVASLHNSSKSGPPSARGERLNCCESTRSGGGVYAASDRWRRKATNPVSYFQPRFPPVSAHDSGLRQQSSFRSIVKERCRLASSQARDAALGDMVVRYSQMKQGSKSRQN
jgi:hypothetical protein